MSGSTQVVLRASDFGGLIGALQHRGFAVIGPTVRDAAIVYDELESAADLPAGWTDEQQPGRYRLKRSGRHAFFAYGVGPESWKKFLHPADIRLFAATRNNGSFHILNDDAPSFRRFAFVGVRACELVAIGLQDRALLGEKHSEPVYAQRREGLFIVAKQCTHSGGSCFCAAMGAGPRVSGSFDLLLTEFEDVGGHRFLIEAGSDLGAEVLEDLDTVPATPAEIAQAEQGIEQAAREQSQTLDAAASREVLQRAFDDAHWEDVAARCLACGNCTMVCPTCFCSTVEDSSDVSGGHAERRRRWDSCFTASFSYIHGGSIRSSPGSRYRQWITHKLAYWIDQFGAHGCVGCGRCSTWCPAGIDIAQEFRALQEKTEHGNA